MLYASLNVMPTEISVGQKPSSQDRAQFELWMSNIGMSGGSDESDVARKLQAITNFFDNPEASLEGANRARDVILSNVLKSVCLDA